ncbi:MAG: hypothetical protein IM584_06370 [Chitinophagaceae bacterium]|nr:hypothetical protein [Chitinophagaceae bacterium]MCA6454023.1 hypothetical protein [Chitinophagaceae bacterium]MCA6455744.1 hypothetical protein [Chitinophagaceae bacterium]MCA6460452.1 hypothetical protein [Chitinophagaceae bacterium]MCA6465339.1 hypothetical protein [Chitinophagaceae bacterium]
MVLEEKVSVGRACRVVSLHRSVWCYQSQKDDSEVIAKLQSYVERYQIRGFDDYYGKIRNEGLGWSSNRVLRMYRELGLGLRRKHKRWLPARIKQPLEQQENPWKG